MKKLLLLIPALLLAGMFFYGCQEEMLNEPEGGKLLLVNIGNTNSESTPIYAGQNIIVGEVKLEDDFINNKLTVTYKMTVPGWQITEIHFAIGEKFSDIPMNKAANLVPGQFQYKYPNLNGITEYSFEIPFSAFGASGCGDKQFYAAAHCVVRLVENGQIIQTETGWGDGSIRPGKSWGEIFTFTMECENGNGGETEKSETAFAFGCDYAECLITIPDLNSNRWGWTNGPLSLAGTYTFDLYAGAGQCDLSKGVLVGKVIVDYDGSTAVVTFNTCGNYTMSETHLYVGNDILPKNNNGEFTVAPGQFGNQHYFQPKVKLDSYTITGLQGEIYVMAHAVVFGPTNKNEWLDCDTRGCDFEPPCEPVEAGSLDFYSDLTTTVIAGNVLNATYPSAAVLAHKPGDSGSPYGNVWDTQLTETFNPNAKWIWESFYVVNPILGDVVTFERKFDVPGIPASGSIKIATDNGFAVYLNDELLGSYNLFLYPELGALKQTHVNTTDWWYVQTYDLTPKLVTGTNTLKIVAVNEYMNSDDVDKSGNTQMVGDQYYNPGGVIFQGNITWDAVVCP